ncbi:MAG: hypothetical protein ACRCYP_02090 [Alphaproteobacteria bacterium]
MEIKEIQVTYGRTWQLRQYEPLNISISLSASITEDEDVTIALEKLQDIAKESVKKSATPLLEKFGRIQPQREMQNGPTTTI